ncbi:MULTISPECIES: GNAT family N-acetyltransferase [Streptomyces]|uniref:Acetyl transferase n=1 Tax=Streptomyces coelicolor (strain ATCC BAA-471 / A3(2) / M145) TaxID=100226 RepID=Q9RKE5_STRCO|nr:MULTISPECIES: GNAT family protein [Streptomyces]MDX2929781.1 GNAT family protein [Streptomyces sp. NRRL_B-16638]MDX3406281.1 GNAT family protein [Streptomyces sp. ME02-6977A]MYU43017.1 GNAT family N-acetyltransferase [Streptomyces sp. SID7813]NSL84927.1 GNAT family N-acetyltransferase [Streptomyces coelicolor]QFI43530.1 GNAT family N-acetyltransferase [Streptomyces coelicolor A3(2)]
MSRRPVTLHRIVFTDWLAVHSWAGLPDACRFQPWGPNTEEQTRDFVRAAAEAWTHIRPRRLAHVARVGNAVVGMGDLHVRSHTQRQGEISYIVHPRVWGQGIGTEIGRSLLSLGFDRWGLHRIRATCDPRNQASSRVLTKLGMTYEGRHRHTAWIRDGWRDSLVFSIIEDEWHEATRSGADAVAEGLPPRRPGAG